MSRRDHEVVLVLTGFLAGALGVLAVVLEGFPQEHGANVVVVAVAYASVALVPLKLPQGDTVFGVVGVMVAALALLPASVAVVGAALGSLLTVLLMARDQPLRPLLGEALRQPGIVALVALLFPFMPELASPESLLGGIPWNVFLAGLLYVVLDLATGSLMAARLRKAGLVDAFVGITRLLGGMLAALASVGVVLAIVWPTMGLVGGLVLVTLMALMKLSFGMYVKARAAYPKTVGVLARLAEIELQEARGHAERVAELSTAVGKRMRLGNRSIERLGLAALLHDIGKVKTGVLHDDGTHAMVGGEILQRIEFLSDLAPVVEGHHSTTADLVRSDDDLLAHIVYVVSYYDLRAQDRPCPEVLQEMHELEGAQFDPRVVKALGQVCC